MKKILFFFFLLMPFIVMADEEVFVETNRIETSEFVYTIEQYKDGFLALSVELENDTRPAYLKYLNKKGEVIKKVNLGDFSFTNSVTVVDDNIYYLDTSLQYCKIDKYNSNFEKQDELEITDCAIPIFNETDIYSSYKYLVAKGDFIYIYNGNEEEVTRFKKDFSLSENIPITSEEQKDISEEWYYKNRIDELFENNSTSYPGTVTIVNDNIIVNVMNNNMVCPDESKEVCQGQMLIIYDKDLNVKKELIITNQRPNPNSGSSVISTFFKGYYIVNYYSFLNQINVTPTGIENLEVNHSIRIYDKDFNLVQTIDHENVLSTMALETDDGFLINNLLTVMTMFSDDAENNGSLLFYSLVSPIDTPTIDHGRVIVPDNAIAGETVTIEVKPDKGYTLGELIVMDAEGNRLKVENNTFVMGTSKVTVSALFVPENPNTGNIYVICISLVAALSGIAFVSQKRKLNFLK